MKLGRRHAIYLMSGLGIAALSYLILGRRTSKPEGLTVDIIASNITAPWSIAFLSRDEAVFTERRGVVKYLDVGTGVIEELGVLDVAAVGEAGLLGAAVRGDRIYLYYTYRKESMLVNRVSSFSYSGGLDDEAIVRDGIPGGTIHDGGRIRFGPDGMLYITTGDAGNPAYSQDISSLGGKILRLTPDGEIPPDNPFPDSPVCSLGHRNPQGLDWQRETGLLYSTEHGPTGEGGRFANDELNIIRPGGNYGWPVVVGDERLDPYIPPLLSSGNDTWAPSGCSFYYGQVKEWRGNLFFACLRGEHLHRVALGPGPTISHHEKLFQSEYGRLRDVVEGPDGLYILTSNRDGRGIPSRDDDRIIRIGARG
jgi:glucose/arabinose dehydrogenase